MRKIYQSAPDVPQAIANRAIDMIERHLVSNGVRRTEELPEESKIHLMRELQKFFQSELPRVPTGEDGAIYSWEAQRNEGFMNGVLRWIEKVFRMGETEPEQRD